MLLDRLLFLTSILCKTPRLQDFQTFEWLFEIALLVIQSKTGIIHNKCLAWDLSSKFSFVSKEISCDQCHPKSGVILQTDAI